MDQCPAGALEIVGHRYGLDELVAALLRDRTFYRNSGGGVTLSGGEATLYGDYAGALAQQLQEAGTHVLLETCGHFEWERFAAQLLPHLDAVYWDLKLADPQDHERWCGRDNRLIIENLDRLIDQSNEQLEVLVRIPLVPNLTCTRDNLEALAEHLRARGAERVALLPYNPMWLPKALALGRSAPEQPDDRWLEPDELALAQAAFKDFTIL